MELKKATPADAAVIVQLLNSAYRGEASTKGWTTEAHLIDGDVRTNEATVLEAMEQPGSVTLLCLDDGTPVGTVNLQQHGAKIYLGMFAVTPFLQGKGIGKQLLQAAEIHAREAGCIAIYMHVVSVRRELIDWYIRHGYADTGERKPFREDGVHGRHLQILDFAVLEKQV